MGSKELAWYRALIWTPATQSISRVGRGPPVAMVGGPSQPLQALPRVMLLFVYKPSTVSDQLFPCL